MNTMRQDSSNTAFVSRLDLTGSSVGAPSGKNTTKMQFLEKPVFGALRWQSPQTAVPLDSLEVVLDASASCTAILDESGQILYVNRAWREFAAQAGLKDRDYGVGRNYPDLCSGVVSMSQKDSRAISKGIRLIVENKEAEFQFEYRCTAVAEPMWFLMHAAAFRLSSNDKSLRILVSHDDVSSAKLASDAASKNEECLQHLLATINIVPWEADAERLAYTAIGGQASRLLGFPSEKWLEPDFWLSRIHPEDRTKAGSESWNNADTLDQYEHEYRMIAKDGRVVWINDTVSVIREYGRPVTLRGFMIDITERKETEDMLRELSGRMITAQEEERKRIARELHDDLNQRMALLSIELEQIGQMMPDGMNGVAGRIRGIQKKVGEISTDVHRMSYKLHPSKLDHLGLAPALNSFCEELSASRGLKINFRYEAVTSVLPRDITLCIFRIAQEALQNAAKHSGAKTIDVLLSHSDESVDLVVSDAGCGFKINEKRPSNGLGFVSMRERLRLVNGDMKIRSIPSQGTCIEASVPLNNLKAQELSAVK